MFGAGGGGELIEQRRLAYSGLARDKDQLRRAARGQLERVLQLPQRLRAADIVAAALRPYRCVRRSTGVTQTCDEAVASLANRLDVPRLPRRIAQSRTNRKYVALDDFGLNVHVRPQYVEQLFMRDEPAAVLDEVLQQRKGFGVENNRLLGGTRRLSPDGLIDLIESERRK